MAAPTNTTSALPDVVNSVFDQSAYFAFEAEEVFRTTAEIKHDISGAPMRGNPVIFTKIGALASRTAALDEVNDPSPKTLTDSRATVTLVEHGDTTKSTELLRQVSFLSIDPIEVHVITDQMERSMDEVARNALDAGGTAITIDGGAAAALDATDKWVDMTLAWDIKRRLRGGGDTSKGSVPPPMGSTYYVAYVNPDVVYDIQVATGENAWKVPQIYGQSQERIWNGELGEYAGFRWVETPRAFIDTDAGAGAVDLYTTYFLGLQALGEAIGYEQHIVITGPFDDLARHVSVGWKALMGYGVVRTESLYRVISASSKGANT